MTAATSSPTSTAFIAVLPEATTCEALERLVNWAHESCERHAIVMGEQGNMQIVCIKKGVAKTTREFQRLMLTNLKNWGVETCGRRMCWLTLIDPQQFDLHAQPPGKKHDTEIDEPTAKFNFRLPASLLRTGALIPLC